MISPALLHRIASLKVLPSNTGPESLADALFRDAVARAMADHHQKADGFMQRLVVRSLGCSFMGNITLSDAARLNAREVAALTAALKELVGSVAPDLAVSLTDDCYAPMPLETDVPQWVHELVRRPRAGYEGQHGVRHTGVPESQGAHALTTSLMAYFIGGGGAGILALAHSAHLAFMPDVPHLVDRALGPGVLPGFERRARRSLTATLPADWHRSSLARQLAAARGSKAAREAVDEADFIARVVWLFHVQPRWLRGMLQDAVERVVCNYDFRLNRQRELLCSLLAIDDGAFRKLLGERQ